MFEKESNLKPWPPTGFKLNQISKNTKTQIKNTLK